MGAKISSIQNLYKKILGQMTAGHGDLWPAYREVDNS